MFPLTISDVCWPWRWEHCDDRLWWTHPVFFGYDALIVADEVLADSTRLRRLCISLFPSLFWLVVGR
jgi:hypothetical protein